MISWGRSVRAARRRPVRGSAGRSGSPRRRSRTGCCARGRPRRSRRSRGSSGSSRQVPAVGEQIVQPDEPGERPGDQEHRDLDAADPDAAGLAERRRGADGPRLVAEPRPLEEEPDDRAAAIRPTGKSHDRCTDGGICSWIPRVCAMPGMRAARGKMSVRRSMSAGVRASEADAAGATPPGSPRSRSS